jgi:hypothetical protein
MTGDNMEKENTLAKIAITTDSDAALVQALEKVNKNNSGGRVTKTDLASWFILKFATDLTDQSIDQIRTAHFNQVAYLDSLVRGLKQSGRDSLSMDEIVNLQAMMKQQNTKRRSRATKTTLLSKLAVKKSVDGEV